MLLLVWHKAAAHCSYICHQPHHRLSVFLPGHASASRGCRWFWCQPRASSHILPSQSHVTLFQSPEPSSEVPCNEAALSCWVGHYEGWALEGFGSECPCVWPSHPGDLPCLPLPCTGLTHRFTFSISFNINELKNPPTNAEVTHLGYFNARIIPLASRSRTANWMCQYLPSCVHGAATSRHSYMCKRIPCMAEQPVWTGTHRVCCIHS